MLTENEIQRALRASRVVPLGVENPHGPLGLEQVAEAVARLRGEDTPVSAPARVRRPIELTVQTWEKLDHLAHATAQATSRPVSASEVAAALLERLVAANEMCVAKE
jgi:hypothetical protein